MKWTYWPTLQDELGEKALVLKGKILNAGSGTRKIKLPNPLFFEKNNYEKYY